MQAVVLFQLCIIVSPDFYLQLIEMNFVSSLHLISVALIQTLMIILCIIKEY